MGVTTKKTKKPPGTAARGPAARKSAAHGAKTKRRAPVRQKPTSRAKVESTVAEAETGADEVEEKLLRLVDGSDASDSGDDDDDGCDPAPGSEGAAAKTVPRIPRPLELAPTKRVRNREGRGVVYVGRIPHGFYEDQMRAYFEQFGTVTRLRLSRNKKTGRSKHYAFLEFAEELTAEIVARTMDNYLLYGRLLQVKMVPKDRIHALLWKGCNRKFVVKRPAAPVPKADALPQTARQVEAAMAREAKKRNKLAKMLEDVGYPFDIPELKPVPEA